MANKIFVVGVFLVLLTFTGTVKLAARQKDDRAPTPDPVEKVLSSGTDHLPAKEGDQGAALQRRNPRYRVENGDTITLAFAFTPEFNQTVTVQPDGFITLQSVGDVHVQGKTIPEIRVDLQKIYSKILRDPVISVSLKDFDKPYFLALGQVERPGKYDLRGDITVAEAVSIAGGLTEKAKHSNVLVFRRVSDNWVSVRKLDLKHMLGSGNLSEDLQLRPGDMVYVPQNRISKIKPFIPYSSLTMGMFKPIP